MNAERWNQQYFDGLLSAGVCGILNEIRFKNEEERSFLERLFGFMKLSRFGARDFSNMLAWVLGVLPSRLLPSAWGGIVPSVTIPGRHHRIDEYIASNPWQVLRANPKFLDLGCGFPPFTATELSARFPHARVIGADPAFASEIVYDADGNYACFYGEDNLPRYFQMVAGDTKRWNELFGDMNATKQNYATLRERLRSLITVDHQTNGHSSVTDPAGRLVVNPLREHETEQLSFLQAGFFDFEMNDLDIVRCFNVLLYYTAGYRETVLEWAAPMLRENGLFLCGTDWQLTTQARYTVYQNTGGILKEREFAFSVDNIRPLGIVSWFALHDDEPETNRMCELVGLLRSDMDFCAAYDRRLDELLLEYQLLHRNSEGYAQVTDPTMPPAESQRRLNEIFDTLEKENFAARAVAVLRALGHNAVVNSVGHIAVSG